MRRTEISPGDQVYYATGREWMDCSDPDRARAVVVSVGPGSYARIRRPDTTGDGWSVGLPVLRGPYEETAARVREHQARRTAARAAIDACPLCDHTRHGAAAARAALTH